MVGLRRKKGGKAGFENPYCGPSTQATLNQIDNIKSFTGDTRFDVVGLTPRTKSVIAATTKPFLRYNELPTFVALTHLQIDPRL